MSDCVVFFFRRHTDPIKREADRGRKTPLARRQEALWRVKSRESAYVGGWKGARVN